MADEPEAISDLRQARRKAWAAAVTIFLMLGAFGVLALRPPASTDTVGGPGLSGSGAGGVERQEHRVAGFFCLALAHGALVAAWLYHGRVEREIALERATALKEAARSR